MERVLGIRGTAHLAARRQRKQHPEYFLWGFVRHPCDRILSAYYYECRAERKEASTRGLRAYVASPPRKLHTLPQIRFTHAGNRLLLDFVGRFESIDADFARICGRLGIETAPLPFANQTQHAPWTDLFSTRMIQDTRRNFAADFERFGYDPFTPHSPTSTVGTRLIGNQEQEPAL